MVEFLLLDLDDTILDFHKAEDIAVRKALSQAGADVTDAVVGRYSTINKMHWEMLERGEITREQVLVQRFACLFRELGIETDAVACARNYERLLGIGHYFLPGAKEALDILKERYRLFLVSNGTASVQQGRMTSAGLYPYFEKVFVSEEIGYNKPAIEFFDACFAQIPGFDRSKAMIVGDSLTSDMQGGINAGIKTCWVNPNHKDAKFSVDYQIEGLQQLPALLTKEESE